MPKPRKLNAIDINYSESNDDDNGEDMWDDRKLNDAYDKALRIANAEVAKRVAMSTNSQHKSKEGENEIKKENSFDKTITKTNKKENNMQWKVGMPCRALYEVDGVEYEAFVLRIISDEECIVRFLGYENSEIVEINNLRPTLGKEERNRQIEQSLDSKIDEAYTSQSPTNTEHMDCVSDKVPSLASTDNSIVKNKKKSSKRKKHQRASNSFELPEMPFPMPNMSALRNFGSMDMPLPPPPPLAMGNAKPDCEDQAISSMLLSWYMSGYYTGLYQGLRRAKENRRNV